MGDGEHTDELALEQKYFDHALGCREQARARLNDAPSAAATTGAAERLAAFAKRRHEEMQPPNAAVAIGRVDLEDEETIYIGADSIWDGSDVIVATWKAPVVGDLFYRPTHDDPLGVHRKRTFRTADASNTILDFEDVVFGDLAAQVAALEEPAIADRLLDELDRSRTGEMREIIATIQAAQYDLLRADLDQLLVIQGGPGTGKTVIGLHRVSWLLFNYHERLAPEDVLVVGPSRTFVRYIRSVLPTLGDRNVTQVEITELGPSVVIDRTDDAEVARLKGDLRMRGLLARGLQDRIGVPDGPLELRARGTSVTYDKGKLSEQVELLRGRPYAAGRIALRAWLREEAARQRVENVNRESLDALLDRVWPPLTAAAFVQELLGSEARLLRAAGDDFSAREVRLLYRRAAERLAEERWAPTDLPLLDHADGLISADPPTRFAHIVVDEAQDLSPMQLGMIARRSLRGSMTILGDIAQSTGHWARDSWSDIVDVLQGEVPTAVEELEYGYRVPRQVYDLAARLLPIAAPEVNAPTIVRDGPADPTLLSVDTDGLTEAVLAETTGLAGRGYSVGVVVPFELRDQLITAFDTNDISWRDTDADGAGGGINLVSPSGAKGLEFDGVVVVEPQAIIDSDERGERLLYVSLTRCTQRLSVVSSRPMTWLDSEHVPTTPLAPLASASPGEPVPATSATAGSSSRVIDALATSLAGEIRQTVQPDLWQGLIEALARALGVPTPTVADTSSPEGASPVALYSGGTAADRTRVRAALKDALDLVAASHLEEPRRVQPGRNSYTVAGGPVFHIRSNGRTDRGSDQFSYWFGLRRDVWNPGEFFVFVCDEDGVLVVPVDEMLPRAGEIPVSNEGRGDAALQPSIWRVGDSFEWRVGQDRVPFDQWKDRFELL